MVHMDEQGLGRRLQVARQAAGLTQQELCQKASIAYSTLAKIERGAIKAPSVFTISQIAKVLGVTLDSLLGVEHGGHSPAAPAKQYKRSKSGVTFVYFDVNGCLVHFFHRAFTKMAADLNVAPDAIEATFWRLDADTCRGKLTVDEFNRHLAEKLNVPLERVDWQRYYMETVEPVHEMKELLDWTSQHYRVGLLSNIMPGFIDELMRRGLIPKIDYAAIVDSSQVGSLKPEPRMYEVAAEKAAVAPQEILFVDDSRANIMAAERFGWHVLWFDDFQPSESVARIRSALELGDESAASVGAPSSSPAYHSDHSKPTPSSQTEQYQPQPLN